MKERTSTLFKRCYLTQSACYHESGRQFFTNLLSENNSVSKLEMGEWDVQVQTLRSGIDERPFLLHLCRPPLLIRTPAIREIVFWPIQSFNTTCDGTAANTPAKVVFADFIKPVKCRRWIQWRRKRRLRLQNLHTTQCYNG